MGKKQFLIMAAFALGIGGAFASNAKHALVTQGYEAGTCTLGNIDGGFNCSTTAVIQCTINGNNAYDTPTDCSAGANQGLLKHN